MKETAVAFGRQRHEFLKEEKHENFRSNKAEEEEEESGGPASCESALYLG
jgi:hypothetical protein